MKNMAEGLDIIPADGTGLIVNHAGKALIAHIELLKQPIPAFSLSLEQCVYIQRHHKLSPRLNYDIQK